MIQVWESHENMPQVFVYCPNEKEFADFVMPFALKQSLGYAGPWY